MNRIHQYIKSVGGIQQEQWNFYYGPTGIDKATRIENGVQNLTIDYSTDTNGRILSADYNKTGGSTVRIVPVYDNYGNIIACKLDDGDMAKAVLINPNNGAIDTRYDPNDIDAPFSYRARDGFMGIGPLWANNDDGTVYMQGHVVIPNPWGDAVTNGTTTTTTDDTTDKDGGDDEGNCDPCDPETLGAGGRRGDDDKGSGLFNDAWFRNLKDLYHGTEGREGWKDMTCDQLGHIHDEYMNNWLSMSRLGFGGNYSDYNVWDDLLYFFDVAAKYTPKYKGVLDAIKDQNWRLTIAGLQTLDCLIAEKCKEGGEK